MNNIERLVAVICQGALMKLIEREMVLDAIDCDDEELSNEHAEVASMIDEFTNEGFDVDWEAFKQVI